ncbi:MAG: hypothetical protein AAB799_01325, partial [Patescibacteria group bacterium]
MSSEESNNIKTEDKAIYSPEEYPVLQSPVLRLADKSVQVGEKKYVPAGRIAKEFGYSWGHVSRLAIQKRIEAVCINKRWYIYQPSVVQYQEEARQNKILGGLKTNKIVLSTVPFSPSVVLPQQDKGRAIVPSSFKALAKKDLSFSEEHLSNRANLLKTALFVLSMSGLLISGGLYYGILKVDALALKNKSHDFLNLSKLTYRQAEDIYADIFSPLRQAHGKLRNLLSKYLLPPSSIENYLTIDPYNKLESRIKNYESRIVELEDQISNNQFLISNKTPITNDQTKKTVVVREVTISPSGTVLTRIEQRLDDTASLIEATRLNLSNLYDSFSS